MEIRKPEHLNWDEEDEKWEELCEMLFLNLQDALAQGLSLDFRRLWHDLQTWLPLKGAQQQYQWIVVERILACALQAFRLSKYNQDELAHFRLRQANTSQIFKGHEDWAVDCVRLLLGYTPPAMRRLDIPVALSDELTSSQGSLATLRLEIVPPRAGGAYHYPPDSLLTYPKPNFCEALSSAWIAANEFVEQDRVQGHFAARWRLLRLSGEPTKEIGGRSASGAAALAWYHLLGGSKPDDGIIVLAQIDRHGQLSGVGGVPAKVKAIVKDGRFDTIVVASDENQREAEEVLRKSNILSHIRVVQHPTLERLISVRSWLVEEMLDYLDNLASQAAELPKYYPPHLRISQKGKTRFDDIRQMVQVVEERSAFEEWAAEERERARAAGMEVERHAYAPNRARPERETRLPTIEAANTKEAHLPQPPIAWDEEAGKRFKRAVILADPGFGKTWLLRYEARRLARQEAQHLRQSKKSLSEIILPIFVRLSDVNRSDTPLEESLLALIAQKNSLAFRRLIRQKIETESCAILLDGWDEVPIEHQDDGQFTLLTAHYRQRLGQRLFAFARHFPKPRLLLTSRIVGYTESPIPDAQELELIAFDSPQVEAFVRIWFKDERQVNHFITMWRQNHAVRGLTRIPLMLTLVCRAYQENQLTSPRLPGAPTRRVALYESCLRGLLRDWKAEKNGQAISESELEAQLELLQAVSYALFAEGYEQFSESLLRQKIIQWLESLKPWHDLYETKVSTLIKKLKHDGILITAGGHQQAPLLFLHRTFHEYLSARYLAHCYNRSSGHWSDKTSIKGAILARLSLFLPSSKNTFHIYINETSSIEIGQQVWLRKWQEVIILLVGQLDNPTSLLDFLAHQRENDNFHHGLALATLCLPEIPAPIRHNYSPMIDQISTEMFNLCWNLTDENMLDDQPHLRHALPALTQGNSRIYFSSAKTSVLLPHLLSYLLSDSSQAVQRNAARMIGKFGSRIVTDSILSALAVLLGDQDWKVRNSALIAIRGLGEAAATDAFLSALTDLLSHENQQVRSSAMHAMKGLQNSPAFDTSLANLAALLRDEEGERRDFAIDALSRLGEAAATDKLLSTLAVLLRHEKRNIRSTAAKAVEALGTAAATDSILSALAVLLSDEELEVRAFALDTVKTLGEAAATDPILSALAALLGDEEKSRRDLALEAVQAIGKAVATDAFLSALVTLLRHENSGVRSSALELVRRLGEAGAATESFLSLLVDLLRDKDHRVCSAAIEAVTELGEAAATPAFLKHLADLLRDSEERVCQSAAKVVGKLGKAAATPFILSCLADLLCDDDYRVRQSAAKAVGELGEAAATPAILEDLTDLLRHPDEGERLCATRAVEQLGEGVPPPAILDWLVDLLRNESHLVGETAVKAVGQLGQAVTTSSFLIALTHLLYHHNWRVRRAAARVVGELGQAAATRGILLGLANLLRDEDYVVRRTAANVIGQLGQATATPFFLSALAGLLSHKNHAVQQITLEVIHQLGKAAATPLILSALARIQHHQVDSSVYYISKAIYCDFAGENGDSILSSALANLQPDEDYRNHF